MTFNARFLKCTCFPGLNGTSCRCLPSTNCTWSNDILNKISGYSKTHVVWTSHQFYIQARKCDENEQNVYCCGQNEIVPTTREMIMLRTGEDPQKVKLIMICLALI